MATKAAKSPASWPCRLFSEFVEQNQRDRDVTWPYKLDRALSLDENLVATAARLAHDQIACRRHGRLAQMGSTLAMMLTRCGARAIIAHVGDSRIYRLRDGRVEQLTVDHSMYEELVASGTGNLPPREQFPYSNVITRALGISGCADVTTIDLAPGDIYLLCTDGLSEIVTPEVMAEVLRDHPIDEACRVLVSTAYEGGGRDKHHRGRDPLRDIGRGCRVAVARLSSGCRSAVERLSSGCRAGAVTPRRVWGSNSCLRNSVLRCLRSMPVCRAVSEMLPSQRASKSPR